MDYPTPEKANPAKPRPVITSAYAKEHLFKAKTLMDETYTGILLQRQKIEQMKQHEEQLLLEQQRTMQSNEHDHLMQQEKMSVERKQLTPNQT